MRLEKKNMQDVKCKRGKGICMMSNVRGKMRITA